MSLSPLKTGRTTSRTTVAEDERQRSIVGCVLGTAVGDALGLPYEGLSRQRGVRLLGPPDRYRFFFGRGMVSDDTEHTCLVAQALISAGDDLDMLERSLAGRFRWWLLGIPAGVGLATLRAILKLWLGFSPRNSGVFSAGNGPAMRAAILGAAATDDTSLRATVRISSRITHTDPKAEQGALAIALAAQLAARTPALSAATLRESFCHALYLELSEEPQAEEFLGLVQRAADSVAGGQSTGEFAQDLGLTNGVSGYTLHSVPVALHAWLSHPQDFAAAVQSVIVCGGDADTTAAMVGGIVGTAVGLEGIPQDWLDTLCEWPRSVSWMKSLGAQLAARRPSEESPSTEHRPQSRPQSRPQNCPPTATRQRILRAVPRRVLWCAAILLRNVFFMCIVLYHGFRRLLPPW